MIIVDVETTDLDRSTAQVINLGAVHLESNAELEIECAPDLVYRDFFDDATTKIHGVTQEEFMSRESSPITDIAFRYLTQKDTVNRFVDFCLTYEDKPLLGGHNLGGFDCMILHRIWDGTFDMSWELGYRYVDIHSLAWLLFNKSMGSNKIAQSLGIDKEQSVHTGISGARHEAKIIKALLAFQDSHYRC